jgi:L-ribulose-5-phosphate 3-epimerase
MKPISPLKIGIYEKAIPLQLSWPEKFEAVKAAGYDFLELSIDGLEPRIRRLDWTQAEITSIKRASEAAGVPVLTMALTANRYYPLGEADAEIRRQGLAIVRRGIQVAQRMGIRLIHLAAYDVCGKPGTTETDRLFRLSLSELERYAAANAVMLALEVMDVPYSNTTERISQFIQEVDSPWLQIYADIANIAAGGTNPVIDVPKGGKHIVGVHLKDSILGCIRDILFGEGIVDFKACFKMFIELDYSGLFVVEMWSKEDMAFLPYLKTVNDYLRCQIREAESELGCCVPEAEPLTNGLMR